MTHFIRFPVSALLVTLLTGTSVLAQQTASTPIPRVANCLASDYVTTMEQNPVINISRFSYTPRCLKVVRGTVVTIRAAEFHPVQAMPPVAGAANPFFDPNGGSTVDVTRTMNTPGIYGYFCTNHGDETGQGMSGAIFVE